MRVLVTGAGGQLGHDTVAACERAGDTVIAADRAVVDVTDRDAVLGAITSAQPDAVINCAAWTAVDACEDDPDRALLANGMAVRHVAEACHRVGAHLVHVGTDYVFDGSLDRPYHEWDDTNPQSVYGMTKLLGEREALALGPAAAVVRTSWVCGEHGNNMVKTVLRLVDSHPQLAFVDDQVGHPTFTADLGPVLRQVALDRRSGVMHLTNQSAVSWYEFVREIVRLVGRDPDATVRPISTADLQPPRPAPRPANSVLDNAVARMTGMAPMRDFRDPLAELVRVLTA
ncbi:MAG: dTDP-4-dehydrorhamnose reductase [Acidimicrobiales bacterium]|nr:dTDP-4-dehydrorhamnose reductase [Acidimicrobiales bacterium]MCB9394796.1 dTDP-4-dehydrorhamnose reductase [Acidimicrobiaceae bacterium]